MITSTKTMYEKGNPNTHNKNPKTENTESALKLSIKYFKEEWRHESEQ